MPIMTRVRALAALVAPAAFVGGCGFLWERFRDPDASRLRLFALGALWGVLLAGLQRSLPVAPRAYPFVGLVLGPASIALFVGDAATPEERRATLIALALLGACVGLVDAAPARRADEDP
jgi:hypothetical protein